MQSLCSTYVVPIITYNYLCSAYNYLCSTQRRRDDYFVPLTETLSLNKERDQLSENYTKLQSQTNRCTQNFNLLSKNKLPHHRCKQLFNRVIAMVLFDLQLGLFLDWLFQELQLLYGHTQKTHYPKIGQCVFSCRQVATVATRNPQ